MLRCFTLALPLALVLAATPVTAQQNSGQPRPSAAPDTKEIRVSVSISFFVAGPTNDGEASRKIQDGARRALYESAVRECSVLTSSIASECKLQSISINMNRGQGQQYQEGYNANGNFGFLVTLK